MNGYEFLRKTPELVLQRRIGLDWYANLAQISQLTVHLVILVCESVASAQVRGFAKNQKGGAAVLARGLKFTLGTDVIKGYGTYGQWIFGMAWTSWLGFLCINETAPGSDIFSPRLGEQILMSIDYLHLTKRFGLVAASQLPIHYLLASTPLKLLLNSSFRLNMSLHKVTGKIILALFAAHISLYSFCFVKMGIFWQSVQQSNILVAVISAGILSILGTTATQFFRRRYYSWFYKAHVIGSAVVLPLLFFHVSHIRLYLFESGAVLIINAVLRTFSSRN
jgi:Ferric reductase like transmembrane component